MGSISAPHPTAISVSLSDLESGTVDLSTLEQAFGPNSLGIILVRDLPSTYPALRKKLLSYSSFLANLPASELANVEKPEARYNIGWSHGKEKLDSGKFDTSKGSFYIQPGEQNEELVKKAREMYPELKDMTSENVWPDEDVLPGFKETVESMCELIVSVAALVARACDRYGKANLEGYGDGVLENIVRGSVSTKARLLHYFPAAEPTPPVDDAKQEEKDDDSWCGTHTDLGALTGLTSNMFVDEALHAPLLESSKDGILEELDAHPDPKAGLWIKDRSGRTTQVDIPRDCLAFQTGEALQLITQGKFRAVPHFVRGARAGKGAKIARNTLAVFTQPNLWEVVDQERGLDFAGLAKEIFGKTY